MRDIKEERERVHYLNVIQHAIRYYDDYIKETNFSRIPDRYIPKVQSSLVALGGTRRSL